MTATPADASPEADTVVVPLKIIERVRDALSPFAKDATEYSVYTRDDFSISGDQNDLTVGDMREAFDAQEALDEALKTVAPSPAAPVGGEPVAWLVTWIDTTPPLNRCRVQIGKTVERWLEDLAPTFIPLFAHPAPMLDGGTDQGPGEAWKPGREDFPAIRDLILKHALTRYGEKVTPREAVTAAQAVIDYLALRPSAAGKVKP